MVKSTNRGKHKGVITPKSSGKPENKSKRLRSKSTPLTLATRSTATVNKLTRPKCNSEGKITHNVNNKTMLKQLGEFSGQNNNATAIQSKPGTTKRSNYQKNQNQTKFDEDSKKRKLANDAQINSGASKVNRVLIGNDVGISVSQDEELDYEDDIDFISGTDPNENLSEFEQSDDDEESNSQQNQKVDSPVTPNTSNAKQRNTGLGSKAEENVLDNLMEDQILLNPRIGSLLDKLIDAKLAARENRNAGKSLHEVSTKQPKNSGHRTNNLVKSPSDTTLYRPALNRIPDTRTEVIPVNTPVHTHQAFNSDFSDGASGTKDKQTDNSELIQKISKFVEDIRVTRTRTEADEDERHESGEKQPRISEEQLKLNEARTGLAKLFWRRNSTRLPWSSLKVFN